MTTALRKTLAICFAHKAIVSLAINTISNLTRINYSRKLNSNGLGIKRQRLARDLDGHPRLLWSPWHWGHWYQSSSSLQRSGLGDESFPLEEDCGVGDT